MSEFAPTACPLMRETCTKGAVDVHGFEHFCAFYLDDTCYVFDALKSIGDLRMTIDEAIDNGISVSVTGAIDTYEQN